MPNLAVIVTHDSIREELDRLNALLTIRDLALIREYLLLLPTRSSMYALLLERDFALLSLISNRRGPLVTLQSISTILTSILADPIDFYQLRIPRGLSQFEIEAFYRPLPVNFLEPRIIESTHRHPHHFFTSPSNMHHHAVMTPPPSREGRVNYIRGHHSLFTPHVGNVGHSHAGHSHTAPSFGHHGHGHGHR